MVFVHSSVNCRNQAVSGPLSGSLSGSKVSFAAAASLETRHGI